MIIVIIIIICINITIITLPLDISNNLKQGGSFTAAATPSPAELAAAAARRETDSAIIRGTPSLVWSPNPFSDDEEGAQELDVCVPCGNYGCAQLGCLNNACRSCSKAFCNEHSVLCPS